MLAPVRIGQALARRGIATSASRRDFIYYPGLVMSSQEHKAFIEHPNFNIDNYESFILPFPQAPKWADKDPALNAIREKAQTGHWGALTREETNALYDGHFRYHYYKWLVPTDRWKFYTALILFCAGMSMMFMRIFLKTLGFKNAEYMDDPKFLEEYVKRGLQLNQGHLRGGATTWNYQKGEWNPPKPWYYLGFLPQFVSPRESGQLGFSKWQK